MKISKVMLISPPMTLLNGLFKNCTVPLGIAYLGAVLEGEGYEVKLLDAVVEDINHEEPVDQEHIRYGLSFEEIEKRIRDFSPDVVGITCLFSLQYRNVLLLTKLVKGIDKKIITVVGGEHPSALPVACMQDKNTDFIVIGEGEHSFLHLLKEVQGGKNFFKIDGLAFRKNGKTVVNPKTKFIENLDALPFPARHLLPMEKYFSISLPQSLTYQDKRHACLTTSRGCSGKCVFCATTKFWGNRFRPRSPENVLQEIQHLVEDYGVKELHFIDDNLTLDKERAMKIFQGMIDRKFNLKWCVPQGLAIWTLDEELIKKMQESGCYLVDLGVESGNQDVLWKIIKKPINLKRVKGLVKTFKKHGMLVKACFVIGLPGETKEQIRQTFDFADELDLDGVSIAIATPLPGTELFRICKEKKLFRCGFDENAIEYYVGNIETDEFKPEELQSMLSHYMLKYNLGLLLKHPLRFFKRFSKLLFRHPAMLIKYIFFLLKRRSKVIWK